MIYLETGSFDPTWNLAFEEYCLKEVTQFPEIILLWQNSNAVILGRYQNAEKEVNAKAVQDIGAKIVRRSTGGGAVYHDMGNLNYSFIFPVERTEDIDIHTLSKPITDALNKLGIPAEIQGRNDIVLNSKKISGAAQRYHRGRVLHHGTLLFDSNLDILEKVLCADISKITSKGISSVRSRVANIQDYLHIKNYDINAFKKDLLNTLAMNNDFESYSLTDQDLDKIRVLQHTKYQTWDWNMGSSPPFTYKNSKRFPGGQIEIHVHVERGTIQRCKIWGDFLGLISLDELEASLQGVRYTKTDVLETLKNLDLRMFLGSLSATSFVECLFQEATLPLLE
ncbi:MAG: lipoate--protein ligase [Peptococcaceae bacterium]|nr:lipoate--protein ligase [Peptococcaceae bacterium]